VTAPASADRDPRRKRGGWLWFVAWAISGALLAVGIVGSFGVLVIVLPIGALSALVLILTARSWPEVLGVGSGIGSLALGIAFLNRNYSPCPDAPTTGIRLPGHRPPDCGGIDPLPWLMAGMVLLLGSVAAYAWAQAHSRGTTEGADRRT
jgi:nitrate reductase NapE component